MRIRNEDNMLDEKIIKELQDFAEKVEHHDDRFTVEFCEMENRTYPDFTVIINNTSYTDQSFILQHPSEIPGEMHPPIYLYEFNNGFQQNVSSHNSVAEAISAVDSRL